MNLVRTTLATLAAAVALSACNDSNKKQPAATVSSTLAVATPPPPTTGPIETVTFSSEKSKLGFVGSKITGNHEGTFERFSGSVHFTDKAEGGAVEVQIDTTSLKIQPEKLEAHLKSAEFFDTARFPMASFKSTEVKSSPAKGATHTVSGNLSLHGKEKAISFPATITMTDTEVSAKSEFTIDRRDFDIVYPGMPNDLIRDAVVIKLDLHAPRSVVAQAKDTVHPN